MTEAAEHSWGYRLAVRVDDLRAGRCFEVVSEICDLAVGNQHIGVLEHPRAAGGVDGGVLDQDGCCCHWQCHCGSEGTQDTAARGEGQWFEGLHGYTPAAAGCPSVKSD